MNALPPLILVASTVVLGACSPSLSPLYRDYEYDADTLTIDERIVAALLKADWEIQESDRPNVVATAPRTIREWGLYRVQLTLEVAPLTEGYVRIFFHPYRRYFTGRQSKIPYFRRSHRRSVLPDLQEAFAAYGLYAIGSAEDRDKMAVRP